MQRVLLLSKDGFIRLMLRSFSSGKKRRKRSVKAEEAYSKRYLKREREREPTG